jgi:hypothetical protein
VFLERDGFDFPQFFHLVDDQGDHGEIKTSGRGVEIKGELSSALELKMEHEFIKVNLDRRSRISDHFNPHGPGCNPNYFRGLGVVLK